MGVMAARPDRARPGMRVAYEHIRSRIVSLDLAPGTAISENELAGELGVSRTPVREALLLLAEERLVEIYPKVGTFVARVDRAQVAEAQFVREAIELASLGSLTPPADADQLAALQDNLEQQRGTTSFGDFIRLDDAFHLGLMVLAGHGQSWGTVVAAKGHLDRARMLGLTNHPSLADRAAEHQRVLDSVIAGDLGRAQDLLRAHLRIVFDDITAVEQAFPELFVHDPRARPVRRSIAVWE